MRHGAEMQHLVDEEWRTARQRGLREMLGLGVRIAGDLLRTAWHERLHGTRHQDWLAFGTAAGCGITGGVIDCAGKETAATLLICVIGAAYFGFFADRRTWRWPLGLAAWLGLVDMAAELLGTGGAGTVGGHAVGLAIIPEAWLAASAGALIGVGGRRLLGPMKCGWTADGAETVGLTRSAK
jgi:hypothetical protein